MASLSMRRLWPLSRSTWPRDASDDADVIVLQFNKASTHSKDSLTAYFNNFSTAPQFAKTSRKEFSDKLAKRYKKRKIEAAHVEFDGDNLFLEGEFESPSAAKGND